MTNSILFALKAVIGVFFYAFAWLCDYVFPFVFIGFWAGISYVGIISEDHTHQVLGTISLVLCVIVIVIAAIHYVTEASD